MKINRLFFFHPVAQIGCLLFCVMLPAFILCVTAMNLETNSALLLASFFLCSMMLYAGINSFDPGALPGAGRANGIYGALLKLAGLGYAVGAIYAGFKFFASEEQRANFEGSEALKYV